MIGQHPTCMPWVVDALTGAITSTTMGRMHAAVKLRVSGGAEVSLVPGDIIGRVPCAVVQIDDPRISEAHALVSLRRGSLKLMALRGRMSIDGKPRTEVALEVGQRIVLGGFFPIEVTAVTLPEQTLALVRETGSEPPDDFVAAQGTWSLFDRDIDAMTFGFHSEAAAVIWTGPSGVVLRRLDRPGDVRLAAGDHFTVGQSQFRIEALPTSCFEASLTTEHAGADLTLQLRLYYDSVHISADGARIVVLNGIAANALCELAEIGQPVAWQELAQQLWPGVGEETMRSRWDQLMARIRLKLREAGLRSDLIRPTRGGLVQLVLGPRDTVEWSPKPLEK